MLLNLDMLNLLLHLFQLPELVNDPVLLREDFLSLLHQFSLLEIQGIIRCVVPLGLLFWNIDVVSFMRGTVSVRYFFILFSDAHCMGFSGLLGDLPVLVIASIELADVVEVTRIVGPTHAGVSNLNVFLPFNNNGVWVGMSIVWISIKMTSGWN